MKKYLFISAVFLLGISSCKKEIAVRGRVYNIETNEGLSNVRVTFFGNALKKPNTKDTLSVFTDMNGKFLLNTKASIRKGHYLVINGIEDSSFYILNKTRLGLFDHVKEYDIDVPFLRIKPVNLFYIDTNTIIPEELFLEIIFKHKYAEDFYIKHPIKYSESIIAPLFSMLEGENYIYMKSTRFDGSTVERTDTLYVNGANFVGTNFYQEY